MPATSLPLLGIFFACLLGACTKDAPASETASDRQTEAEPQRETPPDPAPAKDLILPPVQMADLDNGVQVNTIVTDQLPVVYATLVVRSGA